MITEAELKAHQAEFRRQWDEHVLPRKDLKFDEECQREVWTIDHQTVLERAEQIAFREVTIGELVRELHAGLHDGEEYVFKPGRRPAVLIKFDKWRSYGYTSRDDEARLRKKLTKLIGQKIILGWYGGAGGFQFCCIIRVCADPK